MILHTIQDKIVWDQLLCHGHVLAKCDFQSQWDEKINSNWGFSHAYKWLIEQMQLKGIKKPADATTPFWAWLTKTGQVDTKISDFIDNSIKNNKEQVYLKLNIDENRVLLSNFDLWHSVLNHWPIFNTEKLTDEFDEYLKNHNINPHKLHLIPKNIEEEIRHTWQKIFHFDLINNQYKLPNSNPEQDYWLGDTPVPIQATFWDLYLNDVVYKKRISPKIDKKI